MPLSYSTSRAIRHDEQLPVRLKPTGLRFTFYRAFILGAAVLLLGCPTETTDPTVVGAPTFSVVSGTYTQSQSVEIGSTTADATIYYTTDETTPTASSTEYSGAVLISDLGSTTLSAVAVHPDGTLSEVSEVTYTIELPQYAFAVVGPDEDFSGSIETSILLDDSDVSSSSPTTADTYVNDTLSTITASTDVPTVAAKSFSPSPQ